MTKSDEAKISKLDWCNWIVTVLALILAGISLCLNYCDASKQKKIRVETILNEAWDLMVGTEGEALTGVTELYDRGDIDSRQLNLAKRKVKEALILDPDNPKVIKMNAECLTYSGERKEAIKEFQRSIRLDPNYIAAYNSLGRTFFELNRLEKAVGIYRKALSLDPKNAKVYTNLGLTLIFQEKLEEAISSYKNAIENDPDIIGAPKGLSYALLLQGRPEEALTVLNRALILDKNDSSTHVAFGVIYDKLGKLDEAINSYEVAIKLNPSNEMAYNNLGSCFIKKGKFNDAIKQLQIATYLAPDFLFPYENLITAYRRLGDQNKAKAFEAKANALRRPGQKKYQDMYRIQIK